ncbi:hypothetical protein AURDEDRAFT_72344 [Auricularia subglabra TFB-10046 SS5]|nr:hypothetical protein AURDEDRAFT_72344 [Auricularia subglabra TFB-10046 SS5]
MRSVLVLASLALAANAHMLAWTKGMYCKNGHSTKDDPNAAVGALPLIDLPFSGWFMHGACINYPPPKGEFLDLPAGGEFTVEIAENRAFTSLSYNGSKTSAWGDGNPHPEGYGDRRVDTHFPLTEIGCIASPNMHTKNEQDAAGTAFAIAYKSDIHKVTMDDLVVFTVAPNTPYKRIAKYKVPKLLPACPPEGCICAWGWVPNHCGEANEYMAGYRCRVTNVQPNAKRVGKPQSPVWCEGEPDKCVKGPKKMSIGFQREGNTVHPVRDVPQADGQWRSWGYNMKLGFKGGAQDDIFVDGEVSLHFLAFRLWVGRVVDDALLQGYHVQAGAEADHGGLEAAAGADAQAAACSGAQAVCSCSCPRPFAVHGRSFFPFYCSSYSPIFFSFCFTFFFDTF